MGNARVFGYIDKACSLFVYGKGVHVRAEGDASCFRVSSLLYRKKPPVPLFHIKGGIIFQESMYFLYCFRFMKRQLRMAVQFMPEFSYNLKIFLIHGCSITHGQTRCKTNIAV